MGLTKVAIARPVFILMLMLAAIMLGFLAYSGMRKEQSPDVSFGVVTVVTAYPGASPDEVNNLVSRKIEEAVSGINGLREVTSSSQEGVSVVVANFDIGTNMDAALSDVRSKVDATANALPTDALKPTISKIDTTTNATLSMVLTSATLNDQQLRDLADNKLADIFGQIPGVVEVDVNGGDVRELQVRLKKDRLLAYGVGIADIQRAVAQATQNIPSGHIISGPQEYNVRVLGEFKTPQDLANMIIGINDPNSGGVRTVKLSDIADVLDTTAERSSYSRLNGRDAVSIDLQKSREGNAVEIAQGADQAIQQIKATYGINVQKVYEEATDIQESLSDLNFSLMFGVFLVAGIVFLFLHNLRGTIIVSIAIPVCLITSFIAMLALGFTINSMSMLALSLAIGVLVDDAIVVLENIYRHLRLGEDPREAAINGRSEIGLAAIAITMADVVVFTPIGFMGGILGEFFKPLGLTFAATVLVSLFVSFTVTPMLAARWYRAGEDMEHPKGAFAQAFEHGFNRLARFYGRVLEWALQHRWFVFSTGFTVLISVFMMLGGSPGTKPIAAVMGALGPTVGAVLIGFLAFGINYWPRVLTPNVRRAFVILAAVAAALGFLAGFSMISKMMGSTMGLLAGIGFALGAFGALFIVYGVVAFFANVFRPAARSRIVAGALGFGLAFPLAALIGLAWANWKGGPLFNFQFMPAQDNGLVNIGIELPPDASLAATQQVVSYCENIAMKDPDVKYTLSHVGSGGGGGFGGSSSGTNKASINLTLFDKKSFTDNFRHTTEHLRSRSDQSVAADLLERIGRLPGANITVSANGGGFGKPIQFTLIGENQQALVAAASNIVDKLRGGAIPGIINPDLSSKPGVPELQIIPDREKLAQNNIPVATLGQVARIMYEGNNDTKFRVNGNEYDIRVMLDYSDRNNPNIINQLPVAFNGGKPIFLSTLASIHRGSGVSVLQRRDRSNEVQISADLLPGFAAGNVQSQITKWIDQQHLLPEGVKVKPLGQADIQAREGGGLFLAMAIGLVLVYMLLASLYDNILYPFIIQLAQPQALVGALLALLIFNMPLNIVGMVGIITLIGLVGKNAILLVDYTNTLRGRGRSRHDALVEAGPVRLRPIMMTTLALILGISPVALALGRGSEFRQTIGVTIIGGMALSTLLTLVVIPCSYTIFDDFSIYLGRVFGRGTKPNLPEDQVPRIPDEEKLPLGVVGQLSEREVPHM